MGNRAGNTDSDGNPELRPGTPPAGEEAGTARGRLLRLAYRFLWNREDAEDAVQEALAVAHQRRRDLRDDSKWWSWTCRILVSRCHQIGRQRKREALHEPGVLREAHRDWGADSADDLRFLKDLIEELPRRQREVIVLRHLQQMSFDEIAAVLGVSSSTARVSARDGRERLRELLRLRHPEVFERHAAAKEAGP